MTTINSFKGEYAFLSNFFHLASTPIRCDMGVVYSTVEHAFQAQKSLDVADRNAIALAGAPGKAKRMGRAVKLRDGWAVIRNDVMWDCLKQKFADEELAKLLLATGESQLIEGNTWGDTFWGVDTKRGGANMLGKMLMKLRSEIRDHE